MNRRSIVRQLSLALASLNHTCRDHVPTFPQRSPPMAFDHSSLRWFGIGDLIAETEGPLLHLSYSYASPFGPVMLVTQDPLLA
jgi:hypothetical protein